MTPRRYLNSEEVGERLGLSRRAVTQALARGSSRVPEPDHYIVVGGKKIGYWNPGRKDLVPAAADDPALLGGNPSSLPDSFLIGPKQWAHLTGWWGPQYVIQQRHDAARRRAEGSATASDIPAEDLMQGRSPRWRMSTYRTWEATRKAGKNISEEE